LLFRAGIGLYLAVYPEGSISQQKSGQDCNQGPQVALEVTAKGKQSQDWETPGEEDQGLIEVGQRRGQDNEPEFFRQCRRRRMYQRQIIIINPPADEAGGLNPSPSHSITRPISLSREEDHSSAIIKQRATNK
jgi:hypothetical protein